MLFIPVVYRWVLQVPVLDRVEQGGFLGRAAKVVGNGISAETEIQSWNLRRGHPLPEKQQIQFGETVHEMTMGSQFRGGQAQIFRVLSNGGLTIYARKN